MSMESAKAFLKKLHIDEALKKKIVEAKDNSEREKIAKAEGFDFTADEIKKLKQELNSEDLDNLVGGCWSSSHHALDCWAYPY